MCHFVQQVYWVPGPAVCLHYVNALISAGSAHCLCPPLFQNKIDMSPVTDDTYDRPNLDDMASKRRWVKFVPEDGTSVYVTTSIWGF